MRQIAEAVCHTVGKSLPNRWRRRRCGGGRIAGVLRGLGRALRFVR